jgi:hypothetical protein
MSNLSPNSLVWSAAGVLRMPIIYGLPSYRHSDVRSAMNSPYRCARVTIARSIALVTKQLGGKRPASIRASPLARYGWKHIRCRQTRIDGRRKALFRLDDIEDRAVNVDSLPMILGKPPALLQLGDDRQVPGDPIFTWLFPWHHRPHCRVVIDRAWREAPAAAPRRARS